MTRYILIGVLFWFTDLRAQSWEGVYNGSLITDLSVLSISEISEHAVFGTLYLSANKKIFFNGTVNGKKLNAQTQISTTPYDLTAVLSNDSIIAKLSVSKGDSTYVMHRGYFVKISSSSKYNVSKVFGHRKSERDPQLIGVWRFIKRVDANGAEMVQEKYEKEYFANGKFEIYGLSSHEELTKQFGAPSIQWETLGNELILSASHIHTEKYVLVKDTLVTTNIKGTKSYYLRRK